MSYIRKIRDKFKVRSVRRGSTSDVSQSNEELPLDHQLTFRRDTNEEWTYRDGHIFVNDIDIEDVLGYDSRDVRLWCGISSALIDYKNEVERRGKGNLSKFFARSTAVQDKVLFNMKRLYDEKTDGVFLSFGDGELLFNNFNVRAFLAMYHMRPTRKARKFLYGIKSKLGLILMNKNGTNQYERVHRVVLRLYEEVIGALEIPPIETPRLTAPDRDHAA